MKILIYTFLLVLLASTIQAQKDETLFKDGNIRLTGVWAGPTLGATLVDENIVRQTGATFALEFGKNLTLGWRTHRVDFPNVAIDSFISRRVDFSYSGIFLNYAPSAHKIIHPSFGIFASGGRIGFDNQANSEKEDLIIAQPELGVEINAFRWLRVNLAGGYRFAYFVGDEFQEVSESDLSAPFVHLAFKFGFSWGSR